MHKLPTTTWRPISSLWIFSLVLVSTFAGEVVIMLLLPYLPAWSKTPLIQGLLDASILTLVMAPAIWCLVVKPLRLLSDSRAHLLHSLFRAQEQERSRIARDLHDEIGQQLTAMLVGLATIESAKDLCSAQKMAHDLRKVGATAHDEVRRLASGLRPGVLEELGLVAAIERLCEDFHKLHGVAVRLNVPGTDFGKHSLAVEASLYRILQESLTNVARHAQASSVDVTLSRNGNLVTLSIADDGRGMKGSADERLSNERCKQGLESIRERAEMLHGECLIDTATQGGMLIQVTVHTMG